MRCTFTKKNGVIQQYIQNTSREFLVPTVNLDFGIMLCTLYTHDYKLYVFTS